jgi:hypothetical protein
LALVVHGARLAISRLIGVWNALGPEPAAIVTNPGDPSQPVPAAQKNVVMPQPAARPAARPSPAALAALKLANSDPVAQGIGVLVKQGLTVTGVVPDQRGMRVKGIVAGQMTTRWFSYDECARLAERDAAEQAAAAEPEPELVTAGVRRRSWRPIWLSVVVVAGALTLVAGLVGQVGALELLR